MIKYHSFDVKLATKIGVNEAIIVGYIAYWVYQNKINNRNYFNGRYWTFNTSKALGEHFSYFTAGQIKNLLLKLEKIGILVSDNFNKNKFDRTKWYTLSDKYNHLINDPTDTEQKDNNGVHDNDTPLHDLSTPLHENDNGVHETDNVLNSKPIAKDISNSNSKIIYECDFEKSPHETKKHENAKPKSFKKPSKEELEAYKQEAKLNIDIDRFFDYYEANGWMVGKNKMKDYRATMRNWARNNTAFCNPNAKSTAQPKQTFKQQGVENTRMAFLELMSEYKDKENTIEVEITRGKDEI